MDVEDVLGVMSMEASYLSMFLKGYAKPFDVNINPDIEGYYMKGDRQGCYLGRL